jgi:hypothetical protein
MANGLAFSSGKLTILQIIQAVYNELSLGVAQPSQIIGNTDQQITQLLALANREGNDFYNAGFGTGMGWTALRREELFTINAVSGLTGTFTPGSNIITNVTPNPLTAGVTTAMQAYDTNAMPVETNVTNISSSTITISNTSTATSILTGESFFCGQATYPLPSDFNYFMAQTFWDRDFRWQLLGPLDAQEWQVLKSGISPTGPRRRFRIYNNTFNIDPVPGFSSSDNGSIEVYEYYSNGWCQSTGGINGNIQTIWTADTDNYCLDDQAMILGIKWRYRRAKGLDYGEEKRTYDLLAERLMSRDGGSRNLPLNASASGIRLLNQMNVPDTGYGS